MDANVDGMTRALRHRAAVAARGCLVMAALLLAVALQADAQTCNQGSGTAVSDAILYVGPPFYNLRDGWKLAEQKLEHLQRGTRVAICQIQKVGFFWGGTQTWYQIEYRDNSRNLARGWVADVAIRLASAAPGALSVAGLSPIAGAFAQEPAAGNALINSGQLFLEGRQDGVVFSVLLIFINGLGVIYKLFAEASVIAGAGSFKQIWCSIDRADFVKSSALMILSIFVYVWSGAGHDLGQEPAFAPAALLSFVNGYGFPSLMKDLSRLLPRFLSA